MPRKTITVKRIAKKNGTNKNGNSYVMTNIIGTDNQCYSTFANTSIVQSIRQGSEVEIEYEPSGKEAYMDITKIVEVDNTNSSTNKNEEQSQRPSNPNPNPNKDVTHTEQGTALEIKEKIEQRLFDAKHIVLRQFPSGEDYADYLVLISEVVHQIFAEEMAIKIQKNKEWNLSMVK